MRAGGPVLAELAAAKFIETHGRDALAILEERAELAEELGHKLAARTWRDMADAAARRLGRPQRPPMQQSLAARAPTWVGRQH